MFWTLAVTSGVYTWLSHSETSPRIQNAPAAPRASVMCHHAGVTSPRRPEDPANERRMYSPTPANARTASGPSWAMRSPMVSGGTFRSAARTSVNAMAETCVPRRITASTSASECTGLSGSIGM